MSIAQLWVEKYRPKTIDDYVFTNPDTRAIVQHWVNEKSIPHILLHGSAGTGKTTLAKILIRATEVEDIDVLLVNGSKEGRKIDWLREKLDSFCATMPFGTFKIVLIDEADYLNNTSVQPALRNLMENYSDNVRFILTCNYPHRIIEPLRSRCQDLKIDNTDRTEFTARAATVLMTESIDFDLETLDSYVISTYPDLRKCINLLQANSTTSKLADVKGKEVLGTADFRLQAVELFKQGRLREARQVLCNNARPEEMESIFRWAYDNLNLWSNTAEGQDEAILIIRRGLVNNVSCADTEINLSATITELISIGQ
jgi:replication factor C small subunit